MIFIILFGFIALIFLTLNWYDNSNLEQLEEYIKSQNCKDYIYSKGSYKAICSDKILVMRNSLVIDLQANKTVYLLKNIQDIEIEKNSIVFGENRLDFNTKDDMQIFYEKLSEKLKK